MSQTILDDASVTGARNRNVTSLAGPVETSVHPLDAAVAGHVSAVYWDWRELFARSEAARIAQHPDVILAECSGLPQSGALAPLLIRAVRNGITVGLGALVPRQVTIRRAGGIGPLRPLHGFRLEGNEFLGSQDDAVLNALVEAAAAIVREHRASFLLVEALEADTPLKRALDRQGDRGFQLYSPTGFQPRLRIKFPPTLEEFWEAMSGNTRGKLRRKAKKLAHARLSCVTLADQVSDFLRDARTVSLQSWQSRCLGPRIREDQVELQKFITLAGEQALRSYLLTIDDEPAAFLVGTQFKGWFDHEEIGYAQKFAGHSPGTVLLMRVLEDFYSRDCPRWLDFGLGDAEFKRAFSNHISSSGNIWLVPPSLVSSALVGYLRTCQWVRRSARTALDRIGAKTVIRQFVRFGSIPLPQKSLHED